MYEANKVYEVRITGAEWIQSSKGTVGLHLDLESAVEGWIDYTIWISHKSGDMARRQFAALGLADRLSTAEGVASLPEAVLEKTTKVMIYEDFYNGETRLKVKNIVTGPAPAEGVDYAKLASILSDGAAVQEQVVEETVGGPAQGPSLLDDEIPF